MIKTKSAKKFIAILANISLLLNSFTPFLFIAQPVYAEETIPTPTEIVQITEPTAIPTSTSTSELLEPTVIPTIEPTAIPTITSTIEVTPTIQSTPTPTNIPSPWTFEKVELNKEYIAPQNNEIKLTFTKLPSPAGNIKIEEITLTKEQIEQTESLSEKVYSITSDMADGSFTYNLSLPIPVSSRGENISVKFAEEISKIDSAQKVENAIVKTDTSISIKNLNHFTIFIPTSDQIMPNSSVIFAQSNTNPGRSTSISSITTTSGSDVTLYISLNLGNFSNIDPKYKLDTLITFNRPTGVTGSIPMTGEVKGTTNYQSMGSYTLPADQSSFWISQFSDLFGFGRQSMNYSMFVGRNYGTLTYTIKFKLPDGMSAKSLNISSQLVGAESDKFTTNPNDWYLLSPGTELNINGIDTNIGFTNDKANYSFAAGSPGSITTTGTFGNLTGLDSKYLVDTQVTLDFPDDINLKDYVITGTKINNDNSETNLGTLTLADNQTTFWLSNFSNINGNRQSLVSYSNGTYKCRFTLTPKTELAGKSINVSAKLVGAESGNFDNQNNWYLSSNATTTSINMIENMSGSIVITGDTKFGTTLMVNPTLTNSGTPTYQWKRNDINIDGATASTYTVGLADIGTIITVTATAEVGVGTGSITSTATEVITKADGPVAPPAPILVSKTTTSVTLTANVLNQFSEDGVNWQDSEIFTELNLNHQYTFFTRIKATETTNESVASVGVNITTNKLDQNIFFNTLENKTYGDFDFNVSTIATASSRLLVSFTAFGGCNVSNNMIHINKAGSCTITAHQTGDDNYNAAPDISQSFIINKKNLIISAQNSNKTYGDTDPILTASYSGFINDDDATSLDTLVNLTRTTGENVNNYIITASNAASTNYFIFFEPGTFTINAKPITVTADVQTKERGTSDSTLTYTNSPLVIGDTLSGSLTRVIGEEVGAYLITQGSLNAGTNYVINFIENNLTIIDTITPTLSFYTVSGTNINITYSEEVNTDINILDDHGVKVRDLGSTSITNSLNISWDGKNNSNQIVADGIYTIQVIGTDLAGHTVTDTSKTITVDTTSPIITLIGDSVININIGSTYIDAGAIAFDNYDNDLKVIITGTVDTKNVGSYVIYYDAVDSSNNTAIQVIRTINVVDTKPQISFGEANYVTAVNQPIIISSSINFGDSTGFSSEYKVDVKISFQSDVNLKGLVINGFVNMGNGATTTFIPIVLNDNQITLWLKDFILQDRPSLVSRSNKNYTAYFYISAPANLAGKSIQVSSVAVVAKDEDFNNPNNWYNSSNIANVNLKIIGSTISFVNNQTNYSITPNSLQTIDSIIGFSDFSGLDSKYLVDTKVDFSPPVGINLKDYIITAIKINNDDTQTVLGTLTLGDNQTSFWLSDFTNIDRRSLVNYSNGTYKVRFIFTPKTNLAGKSMNISAQLIGAEDGNFDNPNNWYVSSNIITANINIIDNIAPIITINDYNHNPTNQDITVTATTNEGSLNTNSHIFTQNGTFDFIATDSVGNVTTETVTISNIDKSPPSIPSASIISGTYATSQTITLSSNGSSIIKYSNSVKLDNCNSGTIYTAPFLIDHSQIISVIACDLLGNMSSNIFSYNITQSIENTKPLVSDQGQLTMSNEIKLDNKSSLDLTSGINTVSGNKVTVDGFEVNLNNYNLGDLSAGVNLTEVKNVGDKSIKVEKAVTLQSSNNESIITLTNNSLNNIKVEIPNSTTILGPLNWNGKIEPPKSISNSGNAPSGFSVNNTAIEVGSPSVILLFDKPISIILNNVTGDVAYRPAGSNNWTRISQKCGGSYDNPNNPIFPGECYISNGINTKIFTYHFTTFAGLTKNSASSSSNNSSSSSSSNNSSSSYSSNNSSSSCSSSVCNDSKPESAPVLISARVTGFNEVTLTWKPAKGSVTYYLVAYGNKPGQMIYGNPNVGGRDTLSYTVKGLSIKNRYYFKVRAGNGCTPGDFSNEVSVVVTKGGSYVNQAVGFYPNVLGASTVNKRIKKPLNSNLIIPESTPKGVTPTEIQKQSDNSNKLFDYIKKIFSKFFF
ncbi:MAG: MBG domain-containing protein [Candidatus Shapirobacteria bacterium]